MMSLLFPGLTDWHHNLGFKKHEFKPFCSFLPFMGPSVWKRFACHQDRKENKTDMSWVIQVLRKVPEGPHAPLSRGNPHPSQGFWIPSARQSLSSLASHPLFLATAATLVFLWYFKPSKIFLTSRHLCLMALLFGVLFSYSGGYLLLILQKGFSRP